MLFSARRTQAYGWLLLNTVAFGLTIPIVKWGIGDTSPFRFLMYRFAIATLIAIPILWHFRQEIYRFPKRIFLAVCLELLGCTLGLGILYIAVTMTSSLEANLILTTGPIFVTIGGLLFLREKITKREWFGVSIATVMTLVMTILPFLATGLLLAAGTGNLIGNLLILVHNVVNVTYCLLAKKVYHQMPKLMATCMSAVVGLISFSLLAFWKSDWNWQTFTHIVSHDLTHPSVWIIAIFAAVVTSFIGLTTFIKGQDLIEASEATLFGYLQPAIYIPASFLILGEKLQPFQIFCFSLVMFGVFLAEWKPRHKLAKKKLKAHSIHHNHNH